MPQITNRHILIADDDHASLVLLEVLAQSLGCQVTLMADGKQVVECAKHIKPAMMLLDLHLPHTDGFQICSQIKDDPDLRNIPIIFITADIDNLKKNQAFDVGCADYITKPIDISAVKLLIQSHLPKTTSE